jgi:hypothetical protein
MSFGDQLRAMETEHVAGAVPGDAYEVVLNGQPVESSNATTGHSMHEVLDYLRAECTHDAKGLADKFSHLDQALDRLTLDKGTDGFLVVRREQDDRGFVLCFAVDGPQALPDTLGRLKRAGMTGDLAQVGDLRYATVHRQGTGTWVSTVWTRGSFSPTAMFPKAGDAPGEDFGGVPRPEGGRRIVSGTIVGAPVAINAYEVMGPSAPIRQHVDEMLVTAGWKAVPMAKGVPDIDHFFTLGNTMDVGVDVREVRPGVTHVSYVVSKGIGSAAR